MKVRDGYNIVEFTRGVPQFLGTDLREYGPFKEGDKAQLPEKIAKVIKNRDRGKVIA